MQGSVDTEASPRSEKGCVIINYMLCSSLMLLTNKLSVHFLSKPGLVLCIQFTFSAVCAYAIGKLGISEVDALEWDKVSKFWPAAAAQIVTVFTGMKALQYSNVETFIVFRASMPLVLSVLDYAFLGRELPGLRSAGCLGVQSPPPQNCRHTRTSMCLGAGDGAGDSDLYDDGQQL